MGVCIAAEPSQTRRREERGQNKQGGEKKNSVCNGSKMMILIQEKNSLSSELPK